MRRRLPLLALILAFLVGCAAVPGRERDLPGVQKLTWFGYLDAADLTAACAPGRPDRYRFVYNAHYAEQIRTYEVAVQPDGSAALEAAVQGAAGLELSTRSFSFSDPLASWRWRRSALRLTPELTARLTDDLARSGAFAPAPSGLRLPSNAFYWIAAGCRAGAPFYHAWMYPSDGYAALTFPDLLYGLDGTGLPVNPPRRRDPGERTSANIPPRVQGEAYRIPYFEVELDTLGLKGVPAL